MMEARARVLELINAAWTTQAIGVACELGLPDRLAAGARSARELSQATATDPEALERLLRALSTLELVIEDTEGRFALAAEAQVLCAGREDSLAAWARLSSGRLWSNWAELGESIRTGRSARSRRDAPDDFTVLNADADGAEAFNAAMVALSRPIARAAASLLDWSGARVVVDVGGGAGELAVGLLAAHPHLRGVVFDLEHAAPAAARIAAEAGVAARCGFVAGSFFDAVPRGDALMLKSVLHNWGDDRARCILERCAASLDPGGRLIILERLMPERLTGGAGDRDVARSDLNMLVGCAGVERTEARFRELLAGAGLELLRARPLVAGFHALEAQPRERE